MKLSDKTIQIVRWTLLSIAGLIVFYISYNFPVYKADSHLIAIVFTTFFLSPYLQIQLPRTKVHLSISDALIFITLMMYGLEVGVCLAVLEVILTCADSSPRRKLPSSPKRLP